jgi:hypothetical protein
MTLRERELEAEVRRLKLENATLEKFRRWYVVGELRARQALSQREREEMRKA